MNPEIDLYLAEGCGRCPLGGTPDCKVHNWQEELIQLRRIILECGLVEELKWKHPCYTYQNNNVLLLGAFKDYCMLSFLKGALLQDVNGLLVKPGENTQVGRVIRFTSVEQILEIENTLKTYIYEAVEVEKAGLKGAYKSISEYAIPEELQQKFIEDPDFQAAFEALTPGRQKGYLLYFSAAKQAKTREARIEKYMTQIFAGKGIHD
ncbi:MAG: YdeI/OmpD-associated family protein [Bacteroidia bacterium]